MNAEVGKARTGHLKPGVSVLHLSVFLVKRKQEEEKLSKLPKVPWLKSSSMRM